MFDTLTQKLIDTFRSLNGKTRLTEEVLDEVCRQLRTNLLEADVNVKVVKDFIQSVRTRALGKEVQHQLSPEQTFIRIVYEELAKIMGEKESPLNFQVRPPAVFLLVGLQGAGKTTTVVKLAHYIKKRLKKDILVASLDVHRPGAIEQLRVGLEPFGIDYFESSELTSVSDRAILSKEEAIRKNVEVLLVDTAGRLHVDNEMMEEIQDVVSVYNTAKPSPPC
jgi:signal recognition particle subunit SRP54